MLKKNSRYLSKSHLKRFTLEAAASAILTLNAETAIADPCPPEIQGTVLEGQICEFSQHLSVTVEDGGVVGAITMTNYQPAGSSIVITAGGSIDNNDLITGATGAIVIDNNSQLTQGISNSGFISSTNLGINIRNTSTIHGGVSNSGLISSTFTTLLVELNSVIVGDISNSGSIISTTDNDNGIVISGLSHITGNIINTHLIQAGVSGNGILLTGNSIVTESILNNGTVSVGNSGIRVANVSTVSGSIINNGLISTNRSHGVIARSNSIIKDILNNGRIEAGDLGITIQNGSVVEHSIINNGLISGLEGISITSSSIVHNGIFNAGTIQGDNRAIFIDAGSTVDSININGQSARVIGDVDAVSTDFNITTNSTFTSEGNYSVQSFNIATNAVFNMANSITTLFGVNNAGTLAIGNTTRLIHGGGYTQAVGGTFQTKIINNKNYGQLAVDDIVNLSQSGNINVLITQDSSIQAGNVFSNVITGATLTAPENGFNVTDNSFIWTFNASINNAIGVDLTASINPSASNVCQGDYCQGAAATIIGQVATGNPLFQPYALLTTAEAFKEAASQATPELTMENVQMVQLITKAVQNVVPMWSSLRGQSAGDAMLAQPGKVWFQPYGASMTQNERTTVQGFQAKAYGLVFGKDVPLSEDLLLGGAFAVGGDNMQGKSVLNGQFVNSTVYQGVIYAAKWFPNHVYFAGQGVLGYENNNTKRTIPLYASTAQGLYTSWFTNIRGELGWTYALNKDFILTPAIDASYLFIQQSGYQEYGSVMDLLVAANKNSSLILGAYCNGAYHLTSLNNRDLTLTGYAGLADDVINSQPQIASTFIAGGGSFSTFGVQFNEVVFRGGIGLTISNPNSPLQINLNYDLQTGNNAYSGIGSATIKYRM